MKFLDTKNKVGSQINLCYYFTELLLYLSCQNENDANQDNEIEKAFVKTKEYVWPQNKEYVGGATC